MELLKDYVADIIHLNGVKIANHHGVLLQNATCRFRIPTLLTYTLLIVRRTHLSLGVSYLGVQMRLHGCITADHVPALLLCPRLNRLLLSATERERERDCLLSATERERERLFAIHPLLGPYVPMHVRVLSVRAVIWVPCGSFQ